MKAKECSDNSWLGLLKRNWAPAYFSALMPNTAMLFVLYIFLRDQFVDVSATRYTEVDLDCFLKAAMGRAPKGSIKRYDSTHERAIRMLVIKISFLSPVERFAHVKLLSEIINDFPHNTQDKLLSGVPEKIRNEILQVRESQDQKNNLPRARL